MKRLAVLILLISGCASAENICKPEDLNYPDDLPLDFRWDESEFTYVSAMRSIEYLSRIVQGDFSQYHWISYSHSKVIIDGYNYKQQALLEIERGKVPRTQDIEAFCIWLSGAVKAD